MTWYRLYKWVILLIGFTNAPEMFMKIVNNLFVDFLDKKVLVFLDNTLIYSITAEKHFKLLEKEFACLCRHIFYCKMKKCSFLSKTTTFLIIDITPGCLHISDGKV